MEWFLCSAFLLWALKPFNTTCLIQPFIYFKHFLSHINTHPHPRGCIGEHPGVWILQPRIEPPTFQIRRWPGLLLFLFSLWWELKFTCSLVEYKELRRMTKRQKIGTMSGAQALKDRAGATLGAGVIRTPVWNNESVETELLHWYWYFMQRLIQQSVLVSACFLLAISFHFPVKPDHQIFC